MFLIHKIKQSRSGFSLIELMIAITFVSVMVVFIFNVSSENNKLWRLQSEKTKAVLYASQSIEAIKLLDWSDFVAGTYHLELQPDDSWALISGTDLLENKYTRAINVENVYRESSDNGNVHGDIAPTGFYDPDTKKIVVGISWQNKFGFSQAESIETYIHRWKADRWGQADWTGGAGQDNWSDQTKFYGKNAGMDVTISGVATLISGFLDWSEASTTDTLNFAASSGVNYVAVDGDRAYIGTANYSSGREFYVVDINNISNIFELGSAEVGSSVTGVVLQGDRAYLSTRKDSGEIVIVNISNDTSPTVTTNYSISGSTDALAIAVDGTELYVAQGSRLYAYNISNPDSPVELDNLQISSNITALEVTEDSLYMATEQSDRELQIVDITNPSNLSVIGYYNLSGSLLGTDVHVRGNRAYISTQNYSSGAEFYIFDITDPSDPVYIGQYEVGSRVWSFAIVGPYALLGQDSSSAELKVIDISFPATINVVSTFDLVSYLNDIAANCAVLYGATRSSSAEMLTFSTGAYDCDYASSGELESSTYDTGSSQVSYNWIAWDGSAPYNTLIKLQVATSDSSTGPWNYIGPDGTANTYYTSQREFINYSATLNHRYVRYKAVLESTNELQVPVLEKVTISYSTYP